MILTTEKEKKDYYYGLIARLADDVGKHEEAIKWLVYYRSLTELKDKANEYLNESVEVS